MLPTNLSQGAADLGSPATGEVMSVMSQELANAVDDLLPDDFELFELQGDESVYFNFSERQDEAVAEIRFTTPREQGSTEGLGPRYALIVVVDGPDPDNKTTWFNIQDAVEFGVKYIKQSLRVD